MSGMNNLYAILAKTPVLTATPALATKSGCSYFKSYFMMPGTRLLCQTRLQDRVTMYPVCGSEGGLLRLAAMPLSSTFDDKSLNWNSTTRF